MQVFGSDRSISRGGEQDAAAITVSTMPRRTMVLAERCQYDLRPLGNFMQRGAHFIAGLVYDTRFIHRPLDASVRLQWR